MDFPTAFQVPTLKPIHQYLVQEQIFPCQNFYSREFQLKPALISIPGLLAFLEQIRKLHNILKLYVFELLPNNPRVKHLALDGE